MAVINPYLNFMGNTEDAFNFYKSVFGGEFIGGINRFEGTPGSENMSEADKKKVMHVALPIGKENILMGTDMLEAFGHKMNQGNNFSISINADTKEEADRLFKGISAGGKIEMPLADAFWGAYFGMCTDKFGIQWMVNYEYPKK